MTARSSAIGRLAAVTDPTYRFDAVDEVREGLGGIPPVGWAMVTEALGDSAPRHYCNDCNQTRERAKATWDSSKLGPEAGRFVRDLLQERRKQEQSWGNDHDDRHTGSEWVWLLSLYLGRLSQGIVSTSVDDVQVNLVKIASLCMAAYEASVRNHERGASDGSAQQDQRA